MISDGEDFCVPCGGCRQRLREFIVPGAEIHLCARQRRAPDDDARRAAAALLRPGVPARVSAPRATSPPRPAAGSSSAPAWAGSPTRSPTPRGSPTAELDGFPQPTRRRPRRHAAPRQARRAAGRDLPGPQARLRGRRRRARCAVPDPRRSSALGAEALLVTNAAGSLRADVGPGRLMAITDHINLLGVNPLTGPNDDDDRPALPEPARRLRPGAARRLQRRGAARSRSTLAEGVYLATAGPTLRDPGRDPHVPHARRRRGRDVDGARGDPRPPRRAARRRGLGDHEPRRGHGRRGALARADAAQRRGRRRATSCGSSNGSRGTLRCWPPRSSAASATARR